MNTKFNRQKILACTLLALPVISVLSLQAQDYYISFTGSGVSSTIDSVIVENLTQGTRLTLKGTDILHLVKGTTGTETISGNVPGKIKFYPNPMQDQAKMEFDLPEPGETIISIFDLTGREIGHTRDLLYPGRQTYLIEGVKEGLYIVRIISGRYSFSGKFICSASQNIGLKIVHENTENMVRIIVREGKSDDSKGIAGEIEMPYNTLDQLKFIGFSGSSSTVSTDIPDGSTTVGFEFSRCSDADHNNYTTVRIGAQVWMAENLKTTKFRDGTIIPYVTDNSGWDLLTTPAYCYYDNLATNESIYGTFYNWYVAASDQVCPLGWHIPRDDDWTVLTDYLGGMNIAGGKLKESGTMHWLDPNNGATNESGFTALPGGHRSRDGSYRQLGESTDWWSATESSTGEAFYRNIVHENAKVTRNTQYKQAGASIRCVKDTISAGIIRDYDGNLYSTVKIGEQEWMRENLKTTHYNDGLPIPMVTDSDAWENLASPGYCWYDNDEATYKNNYYGALYNWHAVNTTTLCPVGWHVPNEAEWNVMAGHLGNILEAGGKLKQAGIANWNSPNTGATNQSGFTALPGGYRGDPGSGGSFSFNSLHEYGYFWSSTSQEANTGVIRILGYNSSGITGGYYNKADGASVRCLKDYTSIENVKDYDGNTYTTVVIGNQIWMKENLKTTHLNDGIVIPVKNSRNEWIGLNTPAYCWLGQMNDYTFASDYSLLYNWHVINTGKLCPAGWHVPDMAEWGILINYLGDNAAGKLKEAGTDHWEAPNEGATDESGFTALPGGMRSNNGDFEYGVGTWWSSNRILNYDYAGSLQLDTTDVINTTALPFQSGAAVRCLKDYHSGGVFDIDQNYYQTVKIGNQIWMAKNLNTSTLNDGTPIHHAEDAAGWSNLTTPGYCLQANDLSNYLVYGTLYNWYTVNSGRLCPAGWKVPSDSDWETLTDYLGGENLAGGALKEAGLNHWKDPNTGATDQFGFSAMPGGCRDLNGGFSGINESGYWWSNSSDGEFALNRIINYNSTIVTRNSLDKRSGMSVRCIKGSEPEGIYDLDGYIYPIVYIGNQVWMAENLKTTRLRDGTTIPLVTDNSEWQNLTGPGFSWYNNDNAVNKNIYGALYNWHTIKTGKLCPEGWHVPTDEDWTTLTTYYGGENMAGSALKETGETNWNTPNKATNESGFTARPGGHRDLGGVFYGAGTYGHWWSSTEIQETNAYFRIMINSNLNVTRTWISKGTGMSVRCLKNPQGAVEDYDGNFYTTDTIGNQIWMGENLKTTHLNDGTGIPFAAYNNEWTNLSSPGYCWYNGDDLTNKMTYGALYNWYTVNTGKLCPAGWNVPTMAAWINLRAYFGGENLAGSSLKEAGTAHWLSPNPGTTNNSGFTALPGGIRNINGEFLRIGETGNWWSSAESPATNAYFLTMDYNSTKAPLLSDHKNSGMSVRCFKYQNALSDYDGNYYPTVKIGDQVWMAENLKTTHYNDGTAIPLVTDENEWVNLSFPGYCWYDNNEAANKNTYGPLYNFHTVNTGKLCPQGWRVPSYLDWKILGAYLEGDEVAGGKMKESGTIHWTGPNTGASNSSGFTALPGGQRSSVNGLFRFINLNGSWWTQTGDTQYEMNAWSASIYYDDLQLEFNNTSHKNTGLSVRCILGESGSTVTDQDGNSYTTVVIGPQEWMVGNLKTTHYNDGTPIPLVTYNSEWANLTTPGYCWYNNDETANKKDFGALYNWYSASTGKLCPAGWHIPNEAEWTVLTCHLGGISFAGGRLKETGTTHWLTPNLAATNSTGFTALPGGYRSDLASFSNIGEYGNWWSSSGTGSGSENAYYRMLKYNSSNLIQDTYFKRGGMSVRCLRDYLTDYDGNHYATVKIGDQIWMAENLKTTHYNDGTDIPLIENKSVWNNMSSPAFCWYDNDEAANKNTWGALYNWYTVNTGKLCPTGWHVPADEELWDLIDYLGNMSVAGGKLKEAGTAHWSDPNTGATNETGFTALPGGIRSFAIGNLGLFVEMNRIGSWWLSTQTDWYEEDNYGYTYLLKYDMNELNPGFTWKQSGLSVRCVKDK